MQGAPGDYLWRPSLKRLERANLTAYLEWLRAERGLKFESYDALWRWSVTEPEEFWGSLWERFELLSYGPYESVLADRRMPGARWFAGARANYAEQALRRRGDETAIVFRSESRSPESISYADLSAHVASVAAMLRDLGVRRGDRVVAYVPNVPEAVVAFLAAASIGAIWSCCAPDLGAPSVLDRFRQIEPTILFAVDGYVYGGKTFDRRDVVEQLARGLPTLRSTIAVPTLDCEANTAAWVESVGRPESGDPEFEELEFDHPLWILFSSGTTGLPKAIVHGHGGILLEHLKVHSLHLDLHEDDRFFWFTSTNWMMWNFLVSGLLVGSTLVLFDGSPTHPDPGMLWRLAEETQTTFFGTSAPFIQASMAAGLRPGREFDLGAIRSVGSTASPLPEEGFRWIYSEVGEDILLGSASGGTDVCTPFVGPCPLQPVYAGELQCCLLGVSAHAYDEQGNDVVGEVGELVIDQPMPSMPLFFWNDADGSKYGESYFDVYPGVWRHGDWIEFNERGGSVIHGRSDSTIKRAGIRTGTTEFYRLIETLPEVTDSLVIDTSELGADRGELIVFVVLRPGVELSDALVRRIDHRLRTGLSPRHRPDRIIQIPDVPRTLNGKKVEVPVKRILRGAPRTDVVVAGALSNPESLEPFVQIAAETLTSGEPP
ncbi:MAG: acetoacetate--CoA ligase [Gaiellaceae bacterium]